MTLDELYKIIYDAGIVGAGGAGFPTHKKLSESVFQIVVNASECEPFMMVDHHILKNHFPALVKTLFEIIKAVGADEAIIGIKGKNIPILDKKTLKEIEGTKIRICEIPNVYPSGDEVVLVYETTGKIIPEGSIPVNVGVMVINVETLYNIHKAITKKTPVVEKYVTIGGDTMEDMTVKVPIGMRVSEVLSKCKADTRGKCVIDGGPMMGRLVDIDTAVVSKTTKGLLLFPET
ncbi:MAG: electron transport complex protein RnfC, partial [Clostridia bacterium]|nr:electron transport complex protein RnfC [Clostridia bacterium]